MLPREERLTKNSEFTTAYKKRKSVANSLLVLYVGRKKQNPEIPTKVGFVVGKKISKKAAKRNRIKRLIREAYKDIRKNEKFLLKDYEFLIFIARPGSLEADYNKLYDAVRDCVKKAKKRFG